MKFMIPFLIAALPVASVAQSQSGGASGVPSVAIPKTTEVLVIETAQQGVNPQQIMAVMPSEIRATVKLYFDGKIRSSSYYCVASGFSDWHLWCRVLCHQSCLPHLLGQ
jgi:hypothetical protein